MYLVLQCNGIWHNATASAPLSDLRHELSTEHASRLYRIPGAHAGSGSAKILYGIVQLLRYNTLSVSGITTLPMVQQQQQQFDMMKRDLRRK